MVQQISKQIWVEAATIEVQDGNDMFVQSIVVNHPTFDTNFTTSCVYIVKTKGETLSEPGGLNDNYNPFNLGDFMYECKFQCAHE